jgi:hypothetical protein
MTRRHWLGAGLAVPMLAAAAPEKPCPAESRRTRTAAIVTVYRYNSHADVLIGRLMSGYSVDAKWAPSATQIVSLHAQQVPINTDMSRDLAARNGFHLYPSIREALTLGGKSLAVDGVVFIGEHGDYPTNDVGQILYPRFEMFSQILDVYEASGRSVPTFYDKHFSYSWEKTETLYKRSRKLGFPFMAGSSIPLTIRKPALDPPLDIPITEAVTIGYGPADAYGFHTLEGLQCMVERRAGGETGIASVQWIEGQDIWSWRDSAQGAWSKPLMEEAMRLQPLSQSESLQSQAKGPVLFVLNYRDGTRAAALVLTKNSAGFSTALRVKGQERLLSVAFVIGEPGVHDPLTQRPLPNWDGIGRCVDHFLATGNPPNAVERTVLTTGALAFCFESKRLKSAVETPPLQISYRGPTHSWFQTA